MPYFHLRLSVPYLFCNRVENGALWPNVGYLVDFIHFTPNIMHSPYHMCVSKSACPAYASAGSFPRHNHLRALQLLHDERDTSAFDECDPSNFGFDLTDNQNSHVEDQPNVTSESPISAREQREKRRRKRKKQHGNKGKVPWNKGIKHSAETRALIKQRTIEALKDPQIKKKMMEHACAHSEENKAKISSSMRRLWDKRLKSKRLKEKLLMAWAESIAKAAKEGGSGQQELHWDSYETIKQDFALQQHQRNVNKAKAEELQKVVAQRVAREKDEKKVQKTEEGQEKAKRRKQRKSKMINTRARNVTLKQKLTKILKRKSKDGQPVSREGALTFQSSAWRRLDFDLVERDKIGREISLADQIQAARNQRATVSMGKEALANFSKS